MGYIRVKKRCAFMAGRRGAFLILAFLGCVVLVLSARVIHKASHGSKRLELYYRSAKRFSDDEKKAYLMGISGLWTFELEFMAGDRLVRKKDRLEIKENGIVWQEVEWVARMPDDSTETF
jgi:hypothetical protein